MDLRNPTQISSLIFTKVVAEIVKTSRRINIANQTFFSMIPVLGAVKSAAFMDDVMTPKQVDKHLLCKIVQVV